MPVITIQMTKEDGGLTKKDKQKLQKKISKVFEKVTKRSAKNAIVIIDEIDTDNYAIGGESISKIREKNKK